MFDIYNFNAYNTVSPMLNPSFSAGNFSGMDIGTSAFSGYFPSANSMNPNDYKLDFTSILMKQQESLMQMYFESSHLFSLGCPETFNKPRSYCFGMIKKKVPQTKLSDNCLKKLDKIAAEQNMDSKDLQGLIYAESGGNPAAMNPNGGASGIFQAMPSTLKALNKRMGRNTTPEQLRKMSAEEQMDYFNEYLKMAKEQAGYKPKDKVDAGTLYSLVFLPANAKKEVLTTQGSKYYAANKGLDVNHDGYITKDDLARKIHSFT